MFCMSVPPAFILPSKYRLTEYGMLISEPPTRRLLWGLGESCELTTFNNRYAKNLSLLKPVVCQMC